VRVQVGGHVAHQGSYGGGQILGDMAELQA